MAHFPIEHLKAGGAAAREAWEPLGLRLVLFGNVGITAGGAPFVAGEQVTIGAIFGVVSRDNGIGVWSAPTGDLLAEDWKLIGIVEQPTEDPLA